MASLKDLRLNETYDVGGVSAVLVAAGISAHPELKTEPRQYVFAYQSNGKPGEDGATGRIIEIIALEKDLIVKTEKRVESRTGYTRVDIHNNHPNFLRLARILDMNAKARRTIIPLSERQLLEASLGDIIKISYHGRSELGSSWAILDRIVKSSEDLGNRRYFFIEQEKAEHEGDVDLVNVHFSRLQTMQFDRNLGAILNNFYHNRNFVGPKKEEYPFMVTELKRAGLWK